MVQMEEFCEFWERVRLFEWKDREEKKKKKV